MREPQVAERGKEGEREGKRERAERGRLVCFSEYEPIMLDLHALLLAAEF
jgi:hypothetical protein